jgi:two-component system, LytTR family, response regulator
VRTCTSQVPVTDGEWAGVMRTLIVDDESIARKVLRDELESSKDVEIIGEADNGHEALRLIEELRPDLVFLDLRMPLMGGFEVMRLRGESLPAFIIVTAYDQHAIEAFEAGAIDYLLKPVSQKRLQRALQRARALHGNRRQLAENAAKLAEATVPATLPRTRKVVGRSGDEYFLLDVNEILAFQAEGEFVWIITAKNRFLATQSLRKIQTHLRDLPFQRVHRNAIVNVNHVRKMSPMSSQRWLLTLSNSQQLVVSKRQARILRDILQW